MLSTSVFFNLEVSIQALGGISGGNFNPAVSVALGCLQSLKGPGMDWKQVGGSLEHGGFGRNIVGG